MATYTSNYQLHQWVPEDDFLRTDFNTDFQKIDAALAGLEANKAAQSNLAALQSSISAAQSTANGRARAIKGTFTGNGSAPRTISIGGMPKIVFLASATKSTAESTKSSVSAENIAEHRENIVHRHALAAKSAKTTSTSGCTVYSGKTELVIA